MNWFLPRYTSYSLLFVLLLNSTFLWAQAPAARTCSAHEVLVRNLQTQPELQQTIKRIEAQTNRFLAQHQSQATSPTVIRIPVVVHVLYTNSTENISDAQIQSQINVLNQDFRRTNPDATNKWAQAADVEIEFVLATSDPYGYATSGITRTNTTTSTWQTNDAMKDNNQGGQNAWPSSQYLNIWVVGKLVNSAGRTILGYAQFPGGGSAVTDGVVIAHNYFGSQGTVQTPYNKGRTATHEVGHWLNLKHIWGDSNDCAVDDGISDTPNSNAPNYGCSTGKTSCGTADMVENYMDYSDDACMNLFTAGQKDRMRALFSSGGFRNSLLTSSGSKAGIPAPQCNLNQVYFSLLTDNYGAETSWELKNELNEVVAAGANLSSNTSYNQAFCLADGTYTFTINDSYGDGICCTYGEGSYAIEHAGTTLASGGSFTSSESVTFELLSKPAPVSCPAVNFNQVAIASFADQDMTGTYNVLEEGSTLHISGNTWKSIPFTYQLTNNTILEFEFRSTRQGEIQGIALENDNAITANRTLHVYGIQNWGIRNHDDYSGTDWKKYVIPAGSLITGPVDKLVFVGDDDGNKAQQAYFKNVKVYEAGDCGSARLANLVDTGTARVGTEEEIHTMQVYPNPSSGKISVVVPTQAKATLHDASGKIIAHISLSPGINESLDISAYSSGLYILKATTETGESYLERIIKY
jgi:hypothetical protein